MEDQVDTIGREAYNSSMRHDPSKDSMQDVAADLAKVLPRLPKYAKLTWLLLKDPEVSRRQRAALMAAIGYSVSPVDAIPGFIPVIGQMDDLAVVLFTLLWVLRSMPGDRAQEYLSTAGLTLDMLQEDLDLVRRSGVKVIRKLAKLMGIAAVGIWGFSKYAGKALLEQWRKRA